MQHCRDLRTSGDFPLIPGTKFITPSTSRPGKDDLLIILDSPQGRQSGWMTVSIGNSMSSTTENELRLQIASGNIQLTNQDLGLGLILQ